MELRYDEIGEILKLIDSSSCDEFILETEGLKLVVRRRSGNGAAPPPASDPASAGSTVVPAASSPAPAPARSAAAAVDQGAPEGMHILRAPMVGTFYRSPAPGAAPFVQVGTTVKAGDPLCIIEVMKLFTTLSAEAGGRVAEIGAGDGELVEYGQMLFVIKPN
jgi:acetyl-CoA carboxylase biotin carboxyl carrier protein